MVVVVVVVMMMVMTVVEVVTAVMMETELNAHDDSGWSAELRRHSD
jgi:hypothetical protein